MFKRAFETQLRGEGFTFVEVLTMCPTGWFIPTAEGPEYMSETLGEVHIMGELKVDGRVRTTEELHAENVAKQQELDAQLAGGGIQK
jgi:pyruvate/2-oxoacid:ferredoxin oxidoreductase beta subunit